MQYKIQVSTVNKTESGYNRDVEIYSQIVEDIDLLAVIRAVNPTHVEPIYPSMA